MVFQIFIFLFINLLQVYNTKNNNKKYPFKHVIVVGMENHSYDNLLGFMESPIGNLKQNPFCNKYGGIEYCTREGAKFSTFPDPSQYKKSRNQDIDSDLLYAQNYAKQLKGFPQDIFDCYSPSQVPVISTLAQEFVTFDNWFSIKSQDSHPNRVISHAGTQNSNENCNYWYCQHWPFKHDTIQTNLEKNGYTWSIHYEDMCEAMGLYPMNEQKQNYIEDKDLQQLYFKMRTGTLENYTYIIPRFWTKTDENQTFNSNAQNPREDIRYGEQLIKNIYENLRSSVIWEESLLLIYYNQSGRYPDHVNSSSQQIYNINSDVGKRVPAIAVSPWLKKKVVNTQLSHFSISKTLRQIFSLQNKYLSNNEQNANLFIKREYITDQVRQDCPLKLPNTPTFEQIPARNLKQNKKLDKFLKQNLFMLGKLLINENKIQILELKAIIDQVKDNSQGLQLLKELQISLGYGLQQSEFEFEFLKNTQ